MDAKKIVLPVIGTIGTIATAVLLRNSGRTKNIVETVENIPIKEEFFGGVPLSELNKIAQEVYHGIKCSVRDGYLWFHYKSKRGHQLNHAQMAVTKLGKLIAYGGHYPGETWDSADEFVKRANELFTFVKDK